MFRLPSCMWTYRRVGLSFNLKTHAFWLSLFIKHSKIFMMLVHKMATKGKCKLTGAILPLETFMPLNWAIFSSVARLGNLAWSVCQESSPVNLAKALIKFLFCLMFSAASLISFRKSCCFTTFSRRSRLVWSSNLTCSFFLSFYRFCLRTTS